MLLQALSLPSSIWALLTLCSMRWLSGKESACQCRRRKRRGFDPWVRKIPWSKGWQPTPVLLPGQSHGQRSLAGHCPWCRKQSDTTEVTENTRRGMHLGVLFFHLERAQTRKDRLNGLIVKQKVHIWLVGRRFGWGPSGPGGTVC